MVSQSNRQDKKKRKEISVQYAAREIGVSERSVINYIKSREIEAIKVGKKWFISRASFDAFALRFGFPKLSETSESSEMDSENFRKNAEVSESSERRKFSVTKLRLFQKVSAFWQGFPFDKLYLDKHEIDILKQLKFNSVKYIGGGYYAYDTNRKIECYSKSREVMGGLTAILYGLNKGNSFCTSLACHLEEDILPTYSSLIKKMEKRSEKN